MRTLLSIATLVLLGLPAAGQTVTVSDGSPTWLNGDYTYQGVLNGHNLYQGSGNDIKWTGSQWTIAVGGNPDNHYDFYNPNDCGADPPDEGWLVANGQTRPILNGSTCDVKVVYVSDAGDSGMNGDYTFDSASGSPPMNYYIGPDGATNGEIVWTGSQWSIMYHGTSTYVNTHNCGAQPPANLWEENASTGPPNLSGDVCGPLPVEMISLRATIQENHVHIIWETLSETGNAGFEVQEAVVRSDEASAASLRWRNIGFVEGHGSSIDHHVYSYEVTNLAPGTYRYRLAQIDTDGGVTLSKELEVTIEVPKEFYMAPAYPNPFNPATTIRFAVREAQRVSLELYDAAGRMLHVVFDESIGSHDLQEVRIDGTDLPSGIYLVRMKGEEFETSQQVSLVK